MSDKLRGALAALVAKLDAVAADKSFRGIWPWLHVHNYIYSGPTWDSELEVARAALAAAPAEDGWRPIETAEKQEGQEILALHEPTGECWIVFWRPFPEGSYADGAWQIKQLPGRDPVRNFKATHWRPLPPAPEGGER
jgi:hypothetical protein